VYYTVIKHDEHLRTWGKCRKHEPQEVMWRKTIKHAFSTFYTLIKHGFSTNQSMCWVLSILQNRIMWVHIRNLCPSAVSWYDQSAFNDLARQLQLKLKKKQSQNIPSKRFTKKTLHHHWLWHASNCGFMHWSADFVKKKKKLKDRRKKQV